MFKIKRSTGGMNYSQVENILNSFQSYQDLMFQLIQSKVGPLSIQIGCMATYQSLQGSC